MNLLLLGKKYERQIFVVLAFSFIVGTFTNSYIQKRKEYERSFDFVISKIEVTPTKNLSFYNENNEMYLWNYSFSEDEDIKIGDRIYKKANSYVLLILRKNKEGVYSKHIELFADNIYRFDYK